jgi:selenide,water dikinase
MELARQGVITRAHKSNLEHLGAQFRNDGANPVLVNVLADAQTSGGLLLSIAAAKADELVAALRRRNTKSSAIIGRVAPQSDVRVRLQS